MKMDVYPGRDFYFIRKSPIYKPCVDYDFFDVLECLRRPSRQSRCAGRHLKQMQNRPAISKAVTALVVVEVILSIIYLARELLR